MADGMRDNKDFDESKLDAPEISLTSGSPFLSKLSNFWYYHKWTVIVVTFFAVIFIVGAVQFFTKEESDETVIIACPMTFYAEQIEGLDNTLTGLLPAKADGSAKKLEVRTYSIYSEDEMNQANAEETDSEGKPVKKVDGNFNTSQSSQYYDFLQTGECSLLFVSLDLYEIQKNNNRLRSLEEIFGENLPTGALSDGYGVRLGDTYLYEFFPEIQTLPANTIICILRPYIHGASSNEEKYASTVEFYKNLVTFGTK